MNGFGLRPRLADRGFTFDASYTADFSKALSGGANTRNDVFRGLFDFRTEIDTEKAFGWHGGTFSVDFQNQSGRNGSDLVGDLQGFDNVDADGRTQISELWYEQWLGDKARVKVGKIDANIDFASPEYGSQFLNGSFGQSPTILGLPTYPDPALGVTAFVYPTDWLYAGYGIFDHGVDERTGDRPPSTLWGPLDAFQILEAGVRWKLNGGASPGRFAVGLTYGDGRAPRFRGGEQSGYGSVYAIAEQKLLRTDAKDDQRGVYAFAMAGAADEEVSAVRQHAAVGLTWVGPFPEKKNLDSLGVGVTTAFLSQATGAGFTEDTETAIEAYYNFQPFSYLSIKPDLQYVIHPGGDRALDNALIATLRVTVAF